MERRVTSHTEEEEMNQRRILLAQARKGVQKAIDQLMELYQVRVYSGDSVKSLKIRHALLTSSAPKPKPMRALAKPRLQPARGYGKVPPPPSRVTPTTVAKATQAKRSAISKVTKAAKAKQVVTARHRTPNVSGRKSNVPQTLRTQPTHKAKSRLKAKSGLKPGLASTRAVASSGKRGPGKTAPKGHLKKRAMRKATAGTVRKVSRRSQVRSTVRAQAASRIKAKPRVKAASRIKAKPRVKVKAGRQVKAKVRSATKSKQSKAGRSRR